MPLRPEQERSFDAALRMVRDSGMQPTFVHMANTGAVISAAKRGTRWCPGVALYVTTAFQRAGREVRAEPALP